MLLRDPVRVLGLEFQGLGFGVFGFQSLGFRV